MGLKRWKNAPNGKVLKNDVSVAKNYLIEMEIKELETIVSMYLDYAVLQAVRNIPMKMADWIQKLDAFLEFNGYEILLDAGKFRHVVAEKWAHQEYEKFRVVQDINVESDFDKSVKKMMTKK